MAKLTDSVESIVDNIEKDQTLNVIINFNDAKTSHSMDATARMAELEMLGSNFLDAPGASLESVRQRKKLPKTVLSGLKKQSTKNVASLYKSLGSSNLESTTSKRKAKVSNLWMANAFVSKMNREAIAALRGKKSLIESIMPDAIVKAPDPMVTGSISEIDDAVWGLSYVDAPEAWVTGARGDGVNVSVIDTGIARHEALSNVVKASEARFARVNGATTMTDYVDVTQSKDRGDGMGHGTHVAGTVAGRTDDGKVIGIAPDANLMSASVFDGKITTTSAILHAIQWSSENGADIINMSLGGFDRSRWIGNYDTAQSQLGWAHDAYNKAIMNANRAGSLVIAAIGNEGMGTSMTPGSCVGALTVGAMAESGQCAGFSGGAVLVYHKDGRQVSRYIKPDVSAPGVGITSSDRHGAYTTANGTSMATPCVSGVAALILGSSEYLKQIPVPYNRVVMLKWLMKYATNTDLGEYGVDTRFGKGVVNARDAVREGRNSAFLDKVYTILMNSGAFD